MPSILNLTSVTSSNQTNLRLFLVISFLNIFPEKLEIIFQNKAITMPMNFAYMLLWIR